MTCVLIVLQELHLTYDIVFLFTNTPIGNISHVIRKRLEQDSTLKLRNTLQVGDSMEVLQFVVTTTYFSFRGGATYQHMFSTAMGSLV